MHKTELNRICKENYKTLLKSQALQGNMVGVIRALSVYLFFRFLAARDFFAPFQFISTKRFAGMTIDMQLLFSSQLLSLE